MKEEEYISIIGEVFDGYSEVTLDEKPAYVKHISIKDQRYLHKYYEKYKKIHDHQLRCLKRELGFLSVIQVSI